MNKLRDIIAHFALRYPDKLELTNDRMTKMVYLADWLGAVNYGRTFTRVRWYFDNGPYTKDVVNTASSDHRLTVEKVDGFLNSPRTLIGLTDYDYMPELDDTCKKVLDYVISTTQSLNWDKFVDLIYSTFPIISSERHTYLELSKLADEYSLAVS